MSIADDILERTQAIPLASEREVKGLPTVSKAHTPVAQKQVIIEEGVGKDFWETFF